MVGQVFEIVAPVFILAMVGLGWARRGLPYDIAFVTRLGTGLAMPCLIFSTLVRAEIGAEAFGQMIAATLLFYGLCAVLFAAALRLAGLPLRVFLPPTVMNNAGNLGLPVAFYAFGAEGLALAIVLFAIMVALQFSIGVSFVAGKGGAGEAVRQPMVWAALLGVGAASLGLKPPGFLDNAVALIGQMGIPLMILTLGVSISRIRAASLARAALIACLRYPAALAVAFGVGQALALPDLAFAILVLQAIMPAPVTNYLIAAKYEASPEEVAGLVVVSTALSVAFVPLTLAFLL
ncbi:MAG: AEC family transporter [Pikeienuella sp.]|uniref:AEC family transporter n=1 Tax=Pikeienuella sp. TaxID=2831957 RepID=UPI00391AE90B